VGPRAEIAEPFRRFEIDPGDFSALLGETPVHIATLGSGDQAVTAVAAAVPSPGADLLGAAVVFYGWDKKVGSDQVEALSVLAAHSGMAVDNAQRFERQRRVARSLQKGLLLTDRPEMDHYDIATIYEPASMDSDIGGDFFDVFQLPGERFGVVVGDVSGKGAEAAAQTAMAKYMLRAFALRATGPASVLYHLNNALARGLSEDRFATLFYAIFDPDGSHCVLSSGGHPPPLLYRAATNTVESLPIEGPLIGAFESQQFEQRSFELALGDVLVGYTDGLLDVRGPDGMYGRRRTEVSLARNADKPIEELVKAMQADAHAFGRAADDMVIFGLKTKR
jgi:serine phosphatase RsbU (regulator of sigma subunit)